MGAPLWAALGLLVGGIVSFLASRLPAPSLGRPLRLGGPLRCHAGGEPLAPLDLIPVVGWLLQRGRCRHCGRPIDARFPLTEALCALTFGLLWWRFGPSIELLVGSLYAASLWLIFIVDWRHHLILNRVSYPSILLALALAFVYPRTSPLASLVGLLFCGGLFVAFYVLGRLLYRGRVPLGLGDVKLAALIGAMLGVGPGVMALALGIAAGAVQAVVLLALGYRKRSYMPYGTALVVGAVIALLYGLELWEWYLFGR